MMPPLLALVLSLVHVQEVPDGVATLRVEGQVAGAFGRMRTATDKTETEILEFQDGDDYFLRIRSGSMPYGNVVLRRGYIITQDLQDWWSATQNGQYDRRDISLVVTDNSGNPLGTVTGSDCLPTSVGPNIAITFQCEAVTVPDLS